VENIVEMNEDFFLSLLYPNDYHINFPRTEGQSEVPSNITGEAHLNSQLLR